MRDLRWTERKTKYERMTRRKNKSKRKEQKEVLS